MRTVLLPLVLLALGACSDPEEEQLRKTTVPTYDETTRRLKQLTYDHNKNGVIDTWTAKREGTYTPRHTSLPGPVYLQVSHERPTLFVVGGLRAP